MSGRRSESVSRFQSVEPSETNSETAVRLRSSSRSAALSYRHPELLERDPGSAHGTRYLEPLGGSVWGVLLARRGWIGTVTAWPKPGSPSRTKLFDAAPDLDQC